MNSTIIFGDTTTAKAVADKFSNLELELVQINVVRTDFLRVEVLALTDNFNAQKDIIIGSGRTVTKYQAAKIANAFESLAGGPVSVHYEWLTGLVQILICR